MYKKYIFIILFPLWAYSTSCPDTFIKIDAICYYKEHIDVLQDFIDINESLQGLYPQNVGGQEWHKGKLISLYLGDHVLKKIPDSIGDLSDLQYLDLQKNKLSYLPEGICNLYSADITIKLSENNICPPYPYCYEYIGKQNIKTCESFECHEEYVKINDSCYYKEHLHVLQKIIDYNDILHGLLPLDIGKKSGHQEWENGRLVILNLEKNGLKILPEQICNIFSDLTLLNVSNNAICPPYPSCFEYIGAQYNPDCIIGTSCAEGYIAINEICYYNTDLQVLSDILSSNSKLADVKHLEVGAQKWVRGRLDNLNLEGLDISVIPSSIEKLDSLKYFNLKNNELESMPKELCNIYSNLQGLNLEGNILCPPYPDCFSYIGNQKAINCNDDKCINGYTEVNGECYFNQDLALLQSFVDMNISLQDKNLLEIGVQKWKNMRLDFLYLGMHELTTIPEDICYTYTNLSGINISGNNICPPYPDCLQNIIGQQNTDNCYK